MKIKLVSAGKTIAMETKKSLLARIFHKPPLERRLAAGFLRSDIQSRSQTGAPPSVFQSGYEISGPSRDPGVPCGIKCNWPPNKRGRGALPAWPASANHSSCPPTGQCGDNWNETCKTVVAAPRQRRIYDLIEKAAVCQPPLRRIRVMQGSCFTKP